MKKDQITSLYQSQYQLLDSCETKLNRRHRNSLWVKNLYINGFHIRVIVAFFDWDLIELPRVYLFEKDLNKIKEKYSHFKFPLPHFQLESNSFLNDEKLYNFCYLLHDRLEINRSNLSHVLAVVEIQINSILNLYFDLKSLKNEFKKEFVPMWMIFSRKFENTNRMRNITLNNQSSEGLSFTSISYLNELKEIKSAKLNFIFLKIHEIKPNLLSDFINEKGYSTLGGVLSFVDFISHEYLNKLKNYLRQIRVDKDIYISLMLDGHIFSFFVKWKKSYVKALSGNLIIMSKILTSPAFPVYMLNYRVEDLIYRNLSKIKTKNLKDLNVLQVGAGAIGGYIGDGLSKIGAGLGVGIFDICDNDELKIENIGRHVLGKEFIGMNKALALVDFIKLNLGDNSKLNINYLKNSINEVNNLNTYDVIIDATGQIEVSEYLNERIFTLPIATRPTLLHLWIFGNGECVQALLNEPTLYSGKGGCISCLHQSGNEDYKHLFDPLQNKDYKKVLGLGPCAAYTPYSVSSSLNTAGLAIDIVLEWVNSRSLEYNYFTRYSIGYNGAKISDMFLAAQASCPCCKQKLKINLE